MWQKYNSHVWFVVFIVGLATAYFLGNSAIDDYKAYTKNKAEAAFKDVAEIESEVCIKGKHVVVFTVLKRFDENIQLYVDQGGYKETFSVVVGTCSEKSEVQNASKNI